MANWSPSGILCGVKLTSDEAKSLTDEQLAAEAEYRWHPWRMRILRERKQLSQEEMVKRLWSERGYDLSRATLSKYELGENKPNVEDAIVFAEFLTGHREVEVFYGPSRQEKQVERRPGEGKARRARV